MARAGGLDAANVGAIYVGSESHPYAVKPSGTVVGEALGATPDVHVADFEFACKAGSEAMFVVSGLVRSGYIDVGLAVGADTSQGAPGDALEYSAAAGAAAFLFGTENLVATVDETFSFMTDTPDFWRREYQHYPQHGGRFTGEPAYFKHVLTSMKTMLKRSGLTPKDIAYVVAHSPNGNFPVRACKEAGFDNDQIAPGLAVTHIGNLYSGSCLAGLAAVLDIAEPRDKILVTSYGSGAGSDSYVFTVTDKIEEKRERIVPLKEQIESPHREYVDYNTYRKFKDLT